MRSITVAAVALALAVPAQGRTADFDSDVLPVLTKAGCNAAACHGAAAGRGGFKLSLYAENPAADHSAIVREAEGRRINLADAADSLLLHKPTGMLDHEGGVRFDSESPEARRIADWIAAGAPRRSQRALVGIVAAPAEAFVERVGDAVDVTVSALFDDGSRRDVTQDAILTPDDPLALEASADGALRLVMRRPGRHTAVVRYLSQVAAIQVTAPLSETPVDLVNSPRETWIDDEILATLDMLRLAPAPRLSSNGALLRRLQLDLTGRLPTLEETLACPKEHDPRWLAAKVDELLAGEEFVEFWTLKLARLLRVKPERPGVGGMAAFHAWLKESLRRGDSWANMASSMIVASGDTVAIAPANFYRVAGDARVQAEYFSEALLGVRLRCANCHNHPLDRWTQDDYHGLAAIFAPVEAGDEVRLALHRRVSHPRTLEAATPRLPGDQYLPFDADVRPQLAAWLTSGQNKYFASAFVNRVWRSLMGRGLIEPADDLRDTNPASHPRLLKRLADDFAEHGYDLRRTVRLIVLSAAYARSSRTADESLADDRFYSRALVRPLEAEVLYDAIVDVTGVAEPFEHEGSVRAVALVGTAAPSPGLDALGRCSREDSCDGDVSAERGLSTTLHLLNGGFINGKITAGDGRLHQLILDGRTDEEIVREFYLLALSRFPSESEAAYWLAQLASESAHERTERLEDFLWSLLNCEEFTTNH
jgi:hypothetical protein